MEPSDKKSAKTARLPPEGSGQTPARETLALDKLVTDARTQVRAEISEYIVGEYVDALGEGARFPPVVVFRGKGADVLADGFHRLRAYQQAGRSEIEADVYQGDRDDALWFALGANRAHGQRLSGEDKRRAIEIAYKAWPEISQRRIAAHVGCNQGYVGRVRAQLNTRVQLPDRVVGSDGRERPATRPSTSRQRARAEDDAAPATQNQRPVDGSDSAEEADAQTRAASPNKAADTAPKRPGQASDEPAKVWHLVVLSRFAGVSGRCLPSGPTPLVHVIEVIWRSSSRAWVAPAMAGVATAAVVVTRRCGFLGSPTTSGWSSKTL